MICFSTYSVAKKKVAFATLKIRSEESILNAQLRRLEEFRGEPAPPDWAMFRKLAEYWAGAIAFELDQASDDVKARFAELFDLCVRLSILMAHETAITLICRPISLSKWGVLSPAHMKWCLAYGEGD